MQESMRQRQRQRNKKKAEKAFDRQFEGSSRHQAEPQGGPRAAVYKGEMGSSHRRASRMQSSLSSSSSIRAAAKTPSGKTLSRKAKVCIVAVACVLAVGVFLYQPAQQYYKSMRENEKLQMEYEAIVQRNASLQHDVERLASAECVEDRVRQEYGWVKEGDIPIEVQGLGDLDYGKLSSASDVVSKNIKAPDTWYSGFLDFIFGVN